MKDAPATITGDQLSRLTDLTDMRHRQLAKEGCFPPPRKGLYQLVATIRGIIAYYRGKSETTPLADEKLRKAKAQRELMELSLAKAMGELLDANKVAKTWADIVLTIRSRLLTLPSRLAPRIVYAKSLADATTEITKAVEDILRELSRVDSDGQTNTDASANAGAVPSSNKAHSRKVG